MPRPNPLRRVAAERLLAERLAYERERREWTYEGMAKRVSDAGCPIQSSAIFKIEKGDPPRRITVDEFVAFARVFETTVEDLLLPIESVADAEARGLLAEMDAIKGRLLDAINDVRKFAHVECSLIASEDPLNHAVARRLGEIVAGPSEVADDAHPAERKILKAYDDLITAIHEEAATDVAVALVSSGRDFAIVDASPPSQTRLKKTPPKPRRNA